MSQHFRTNQHWLAGKLHGKMNSLLRFWKRLVVPTTTAEFETDMSVPAATADETDLMPGGHLELSVRKPLFFLHIPKTAGTLFGNLIMNRFRHGALRLLPHVPNKIDENFKGLGRHECYWGHIPYGFKRWLPGRPRVVTFLRDPVERALSTYYFFRKQNQDNLRKIELWPESLIQVLQLPLLEILRREPQWAHDNFGNLQTFMLSCDFAPLKETATMPQLPMGPERLKVAKRNLQECTVVGLTERLDDSLQVICDTFGWPRRIKPAEKANQTPRPKRDAELDSGTIAALRELTRFDAELYNFGRELFEQQWQTNLGSRPGSARALKLQPSFKLTFDQPIPGYGWHPRECDRAGTCFCWSKEHAWIRVPISGSGPLSVRICAIHHLSASQMQDIRIEINGRSIPTSATKQAHGWEIHGASTAPVQREATGHVCVALRVPVVRAADHWRSRNDPRSLGVAIASIEIKDLSMGNVSRAAA